jgi:hypothetical protein
LFREELEKKILRMATDEAALGKSAVRRKGPTTRDVEWQGLP